MGKDLGFLWQEIVKNKNPYLILPMEFWMNSKYGQLNPTQPPALEAVLET